MKNTAINTLGYTGIVTLSQCIGAKKIKMTDIKNTGRYSLFNFFSDCLLGDFTIAETNRPAKIMLLDFKNEKDASSYISKSGFVYLINKPEKVNSDTEGIVRYSFIVTRDTLEGTTFNSIGLYTNSATEPEDFAAIVQIDESLKNQDFLSSSALVVDWELHISNMVLQNKN